MAGSQDLLEHTELCKQTRGLKCSRQAQWYTLADGKFVDILASPNNVTGTWWHST
jgi:hypothetical protein